MTRLRPGPRNDPRDLRLVTVGQGVSLLGDAVTGLALPFYMYTDSTQTTVPTPCVPLAVDQLGCPFKGGSSGGGGGTARR